MCSDLTSSDYLCSDLTANDCLCSDLTASDCLCSDLTANGLDVVGEVMMCYDNRTLPKALECDFKWDCLEGSDEMNCGK